MTDAERTLREASKARDSARAALDRRVSLLKADLAARGIGGRIADKAGEELSEAVGIALDVAKESKTVIAGTAAALALWFLRDPIIDWAKQRFGSDV